MLGVNILFLSMHGQYSTQAEKGGLINLGGHMLTIVIHSELPIFEACLKVWGQLIFSLF